MEFKDYYAILGVEPGCQYSLFGDLGEDSQLLFSVGDPGPDDRGPPRVGERADRAESNTEAGLVTYLGETVEEPLIRHLLDSPQVAQGEVPISDARPADLPRERRQLAFVDERHRCADEPHRSRHQPTVPIPHGSGQARARSRATDDVLRAHAHPTRTGG